MYKQDEYCALTNPVSIALNKDREEFTREDLLQLIKERNIERITLHYTGIDGKIKDLKIPVENLKQVEIILAEGERVDGSSLFKGIIEASKSDLYIIPVYKTAFFNPFDNGSIDFICRFVDKDGNLAAFTPDNILNNVAADLREKHGVSLYAMGELEFFLLYNDENNAYPLEKQKGYHASSPFVKTGNILNTMLKYITQVTGSVKYAHNEVGSFSVNESDFAELKGKKAEQVEIEFLPTPVEDAADSLVLARWIIRNVAHLNNSLATFVPKLEIGNAGNGMHIHMALKKGGRNITVDETGKLSKSAMMLIGGLCKYAPTLMAYGNMVSASYLRLVPNQEAPTKVSWSEMNRHAMIRVPLGWGNVNNLAKLVNPQQKGELKDMDSRQTVELRSPDGSAHIHLLLAGITTAADWALGNAKESIAIAEKSHVSGDKHENNPVDEKSDIPSTCVESSEILVRDRSLYENNSFFPPVVIDYVYKQLQMENDRNLNETLYALPDDEKLRESRRIMHRDIHRH